MNREIESRVQRLERHLKAWQMIAGGVILLVFMSGLKDGDHGDTVRCRRLEVIDQAGQLVAYVGVDKEGSRGLFVHDEQSRLRAAAIHDQSQSAFYAFDTTGTIRVGLAQFAHGGGGVALHGENAKGGAVLYYKGNGSLKFFDREGKVLEHLGPGSE